MQPSFGETEDARTVTSRPPAGKVISIGRSEGCTKSSGPRRLTSPLPAPDGNMLASASETRDSRPNAIG